MNRNLHRALVGAASALLITSAGCGQDSRALTKEPERSVEGEEARWFETPAELAAGSPIIVKARVRKTGVGKTHPTTEDNAGWTTRFATIEILETLKWPTPEPPAEITLEEEGWDRNGVGYVVNGMTWSKAGDEGFYFLAPLDGGTYGLTSSFGRVLLKGHQKGASGLDAEHAGPWQGVAHRLDDPAGAAEIVRAATTKAGAK